MQKGRRFDIPRVVASRRLWKPSGASAGTSRTTRNLALSLPLFASVGMVTLAGKLVHRPVGSARLVPVRVNSSFVPRCIPSGATGVRVGARGLGGRTGTGGCAPAGDGCPSVATADSRQSKEKTVGRLTNMLFLGRRVGGETVAAGRPSGD